MHQELLINIAPAVQGIMILSLFVGFYNLLTIYMIVDEINYQRNTFVFIPCSFNLTETRIAEGISSITKRVYRHSMCHNYAGVVSQETMQEGALPEIDHYYYIVVFVCIVVFVISQRILTSDSD